MLLALAGPDHAGLAPVLMLLAECDPLLDEGLAYGRRLQESGVSVEIAVQPGMIHDFLRMPAVTTGAIAGRQRIAGFLAQPWKMRWRMRGGGRRLARTGLRLGGPW